MFKCGAGILFVTAILFSSTLSVAKGSEPTSQEVILNYVDPLGAYFSVEILKNMSLISSSVKSSSGFHALQLSRTPTIIVKSKVMESGLSTTFIVDMPSKAGNDPGWRLTLPGAQAYVLEAVEANEVFMPLPFCAIQKTPPCKLSETSSKVVLFEIQHITSQSVLLDSLLRERDLVWDDQSSKRVITKWSANGTLIGVEFTGLLRGKGERIVAPDATSTFVVGLSIDGRVSIRQREADEAVNPNAILFSFEEQK